MIGTVEGNCHYCDKKKVQVKVINYFFGLLSTTSTLNGMDFNICGSCLTKEKRELDERIKESEVKQCQSE